MEPRPPVILVVDDDEDCLEWFRLVLEDVGLRTVCCLSPADALECLDEVSPDLIVTDLMMGDLDAGFRFVRQIREQPAFAAVPIVLITAVSSQRAFDFQPRSAADLAAMGIDAFFCKPVDMKALRSKIRELLGRPGPSASSGNR